MACLIGELSQQPTWPHDVQRRRCIQRPPIRRQSSQPSDDGATSGTMVSRCAQTAIVMRIIVPIDGRPKFVEHVRRRGITVIAREDGSAGTVCGAALPRPADHPAMASILSEYHQHCGNTELVTAEQLDVDLRQPDELRHGDRRRA